MAGEGEKLVVKSLEVRLANHQTLAWTQEAEAKQQIRASGASLFVAKERAALSGPPLTGAAFVGALPGAMATHAAGKATVAR